MIEINNRNFWIAQFTGWGGFALANFVIQYLAGFTIENVLINSGLVFFAGLLITTFYRYVIKRSRMNLMKLDKTILVIIGSSIFLTVSFLIIANLFFYIFIEHRLLTSAEILGNAFMFGILFLMWNSLYFMVHYLHNWKNAEAEKWQLAAAMKEAQLGNLKAQVNPHFMFNAINNIRALISEDPEKAKDMLLNFSDMFRYSLVHNDHSMVTIKKEIHIVKKYLELLEIQFEEKLAYEINVDPLLLKKKIPPMMIQLLVENAIKHGISERPDGGVVNIEVMDEGAFIMIQVSNTGSLNSTDNIQKKLGVGLQNIRERLMLIYGDRTNLELEEKAGLVLANIRIPMLEPKHP